VKNSDLWLELLPRKKPFWETSPATGWSVLVFFRKQSDYPN
jgi:hypothetical protein